MNKRWSRLVIFGGISLAVLLAYTWFFPPRAATPTFTPDVIATADATAEMTMDAPPESAFAVGAGRVDIAISGGSPMPIFAATETPNDGVGGAATVALDWVTISGRSLSYKGAALYLRGTNFANINALGALTTPTDRIGTGDPRDVLTTFADYQKLREMGGNHVRLGLDYYWYIKHTDAFWSMLDQQVGYAEQAGVHLLLLSFGNPSKNGTDSCYEGYSEVCDLWDSSINQSRLIEWWALIVERYKSRPAVIGIDPVNEPTVGPNQNWQTDHYWRIAERLRDQVVAINPNILIFIESGADAQFTRLLGRNVVYQSHYYTPLAGTHCDYVEPRDYVTYPGAAPLYDQRRPYFDAETLANPDHPASIYQAVQSIAWAKARNVPLYIGEWGVASPNCYRGGVQYMADVAAIFNAERLHWAYYSWRATERRWGTFPEYGGLTPYSPAKYDMLVAAFGQAQNPPVGATLTPRATQTATSTMTATPTRRITATPRTPVPTNTSRTPTVTLAPTQPFTRTPTPIFQPTCAVGQTLVELIVGGRRASLCAWVQ
jgi:hypothetical protein